jgi:protein TonB
MIEDELPWPAYVDTVETPVEAVLPTPRPAGRWARERSPRREFPLWQALVIATGVHIDAVLVAIAISALHLRPPIPPPDGPPISVTMVETLPPGDTPEKTTQNHVAPPRPAPPAPVKAQTQPAQPLVALAKGKPDLSALAPPVPPPPVAKAQPAPTPPPPKPVAKPAPEPPALAQGAKTPIVKTVLTPQGITRAAKADDETTVFYSMYARQQGQEGQVRLSVVVLANGTPGQVTVVGSSGFPVLDNVARSNVMTWHFQPALKDGVPVDSTLTYVFKFALQ